MKRIIELISKCFFCLKEYGFKYVLKKIASKIFPHQSKKTAKYKKISKQERLHQASYNFSKPIKISILVPLYNTPKQFLYELIESVRNQTYSNWELCLADGSDSKHTYIQGICTGIAKRDCRIKYKKLTANEGISENTNRCIESSSGEYLGLLDHDDLLHPSALFEVMKAICEKNADFIYTDENTFAKSPKDAYCPNFKPDYAPDTLRSQNYICHFTVFSRELLEKAGMFRKEYDGSQDYDMVLRLTEKAKHIEHIPKILYYWRASSNSVAADINSKIYAIDAARRAIADHLNRIELKGTVEDSSVISTYRIRYNIETTPLISIMIPNKDHVGDLRKCIESIVNMSTYTNYEIIIIENGSEDNKTFEYYESLRSTYDNIKIVVWDKTFNFSSINNFGFEYTQGEYVILLNNDIIVISPEWIQEMLMFAQRKDVGAVGAMLYYPNDTIQHAGVILGIGGVAGHANKFLRRGEFGYMSRATFAQNLSAVTAACMMMPRKVFQQVNKLDEEFAIAFNDIDLCMRIRKAGYLIVFTPYAELYHCESISRGAEDTAEKRKRFQNEVMLFRDKWEEELKAGDPYYNPNLTLISEDFSLK